MKNIISYNDWKVSCSEVVEIDEITEVVEQLNFKGYMSAVTGKDSDGNILEVRSRAANRLSEMYDYDFSDCYLYKIERIDSRYAYKIRFAGTEKTKEQA